MTDPQTTQLLYISPAYEQVWGRSCQSLYEQPRSFLDAAHPDDRVRVQVAVFEKQSRDEPTDKEYRVVRPDGSVRWVRDRAFPVRNAAGQVYRMVGIAEDITEKKRAEEALKQADRRKDEFLATLAHELRNPLAPIRNAVELMRRANGDAILMEKARSMMERQVGQMVRLVDDLLDISRITKGRLQLRHEPVELAAVVGNAVEAARPLIDAQGHQLTITLPPKPIRLNADPIRLAQVFSNLLANAAKYTEKGGHIWLTAERQATEVVVSVRDTGIGVAADHLPRLFEMFSHVAPALERNHPGLLQTQSPAIILAFMSAVTQILQAIDQGDPHAAEQLLPLVYAELRRLAAQKLAREKPGQTLDATALVHEAYLRLVAPASGEASARRDQHWEGRGHFFAAAAEAMRRVLIDNARRKRRPKHGGDRQRVDLDEGCKTAAPREDLLALDEALTRLAKQEPIKAEVVKLCYFAGLSLDEAAACLRISPATAKRYWAVARAWLYAALSDKDQHGA
jgi:RNA polymerase sigma factor (TIGR02999 family)